MTSHIVAKMTCIVITITLAPSLFAQELPVGEWQGELVFIDENASDDVSYIVSAGEEGLEIVMVFEGSSFPFERIDVTASQLRFVWAPGDTIPCTLEKMSDDRGSFHGTCGSGGDERYSMVMIPPVAASVQDVDDTVPERDAPPDTSQAVPATPVRGDA